jgi:hypothetical protein
MFDNSGEVVGLNEILINDRIVFEGGVARSFQGTLCSSVQFDFYIVTNILYGLAIDAVGLE